MIDVANKSIAEDAEEYLIGLIRKWQPEGVKCDLLMVLAQFILTIQTQNLAVLNLTTTSTSMKLEIDFKKANLHDPD